MNKSKSNLTIEDNENDFIFQKKKIGLNIQFNRVAFIFFIFFFNLYNLLYSFNQTRYSLFKRRKNKYSNN